MRNPKVTSLTLGTGGKQLWLLRSRPDQIHRPSMRGGPSRRILALLARDMLHEWGKDLLYNPPNQPKGQRGKEVFIP